MTCLHFGVSELVQLKKLCSTHNSGGIGRRKFDDGGRSSGSSSSEPNLGKRLIQFYILDSRNNRNVIYIYIYPDDPRGPRAYTTEKFGFLVLSAVTFFRVQYDLDVTLVSETFDLSYVCID